MLNCVTVEWFAEYTLQLFICARQLSIFVLNKSIHEPRIKESSALDLSVHLLYYALYTSDWDRADIQTRKQRRYR